MADPKLPVLIAGDVHGDLERLFGALKPYPPDKWRTVFLGDLVDGGMFGVGALRYARDRPNSEVLLGNHEVMMLWALRDRSRMPYWLSIGGHPHEMAELEKDEQLVQWLRRRPLLLPLPDGTLAQHCDTDLYTRLIEHGEPDPVQAINAEGARLLQSGGEDVLWDVMSPGLVFRRSRKRLVDWLELTGARRAGHGHKPHTNSRPDVYHAGLAINFDGGFSRFHGSRYRRRTPVAASVGPLPPLVD
jgi:hypothetical protein